MHTIVAQLTCLPLGSFTAAALDKNTLAKRPGKARDAAVAAMGRFPTIAWGGGSYFEVIETD